VRAITSEAGVNAAPVHYHFGSRAGLFRAVAERHLEPIRRVQLARLDALEREGTADVEQILGAFVEPTLEGLRAIPCCRG
jgi:AcrR family transcriptional regulator